MSDRDTSRLHGDELTWAIHMENRVSLTALATKLNLVLALLGGGVVLFLTVIGWVLMRG